MTRITKSEPWRIPRGDFVVGTAAVGGGLALGFHLPAGMGAAEAANGGTEINAWVVVQPDNTCLIRVARPEMGQGTLTGPVQLVAQKLEREWEKEKADR